MTEIPIEDYGESLNQWILFISPYESPTNKWESKIFPNEETLKQYLYNSDLTKEHYYLPLHATLNLVIKQFNDDEE
jgi:hypothetical protein